MTREETETVLNAIFSLANVRFPKLSHLPATLSRRSVHEIYFITSYHIQACFWI